MFGYPSRYVEGYVVLNSQLGEPEDDSTYEVSVKDKCAHAWAEVFIDNAGWYPAEFTPGYDNDNPNLTQQEKDPKEVTTTKSTESKPTTTTQNGGQGGTTSVVTKKPANSSKTSTTKKTNSASNGHGAGVMSGAGKTSVSSRITENNSDHGSFVGIFITMGGLLLIAFGVVVHRDVKVKKMRSELSNGDNRSRTVAVYRYMLKYLKLIGITDSRNITDLQLCDRLTENARKCKSMISLI